MENTKLNPFLKDERQKTDDSLDAERDKTNESIEKSRAKTEQEIDTSMLKDRLKADKRTSEFRIESDSQEDTKREALGSNEKDEQDISDNRLHDERDRADKAIELERSRVDVAIDKERELKSAFASHLLERERKLTDKNLSQERTRTDSEVEISAMLLNDEISKHSKTKVSLTTRDEFLAIVSHDLRNPIGAASSCAEMLLEEAAYKGMDPEVRHWVEFIKRNVDSSLRLIRDLLDVEIIAQGKLHLKMEKHPLDKIIQESVELFASTASDKSILLKIMHPEKGGEIVCDRDRIMQVLSNLIGNALKFTPEGGTVTISANLGQNEMQVSVSDTGPGIPEGKRDQIFNRFAQLDSQDRGGLGLGLYIAKMLIEEHQGRLWVQSKVGEGSSFFFTIPI